ncbi:MAG: cobalamin biosynthesis protein CbiD [Gammaproteobacteria bacterium]|nr:cobalamin biosynthesis protein CbiD [Gammaproteobacteria bacterium]
MRRGRTTGTCATAGVKAALQLLLHGETATEIAVSLPDGAHYIMVPVQRVEQVDGGVRVEVVKDAGDDPDNTDKAVIVATVRSNGRGDVRFLAGKGVGTVTEPGIRVPVGEPAINPVPRQMMQLAVEEMLDGAANPGFDLEIGCIDGETIAKKTFNPRLGIVGGISIIGTSGIVEPMSMAAYIASIEVYIRVAVGGSAMQVAYTPGKIGTAFAKGVLQLANKQIVQISNFVGTSLDFTQQVLTEAGATLPALWMLGHPGKLAKTLNGEWDTHSGKSAMAMGAVARVAADCGIESALVEKIEQANTVEAVMELMKPHPQATAMWSEVENRIAKAMHERVPRAQRIEVRLFGLHGVALGKAA